MDACACPTVVSPPLSDLRARARPRPRRSATGAGGSASTATPTCSATSGCAPAARRAGRPTPRPCPVLRLQCSARHFISSSHPRPVPSSFLPRRQACSNRPFHLLPHPKVKPVLTNGRGYGVVAAEDIPARRFVVEYVGEARSEPAFSPHPLVFCGCAACPASSALHTVLPLPLLLLRGGCVILPPASPARQNPESCSPDVRSVSGPVSAPQILDDTTCEKRLWKDKSQGQENFYMMEVSHNQAREYCYSKGFLPVVSFRPHPSGRARRLGQAGSERGLADCRHLSHFCNSLPLRHTLGDRRPLQGQHVPPHQQRLRAQLRDPALDRSLHRAPYPPTPSLPPPFPPSPAINPSR